jgi:peptidoglycan/xylan/chitin deacetylase (PgdA/CDA1 family)
MHVRDGRFAASMLAWAYDRGVTNRIANLWRDALTVLCYHRIDTPLRCRFAGFERNISASPENFENQIDYLSKQFSPISASELNECFEHPERLPQRPVLVSFDDGYMDNAEIAWPILRKRKMPAIVFLATDHIGTSQPFLWDFAAYCFQDTERMFADVPLLGPTHLRSRTDRVTATEKWRFCLKSLPASERWPTANAMRQSLAVEVPDAAFSGLYMSWSDVRCLAAEGCEFGGHTRTHPILTKMPLDEARDEITGSFKRITAELGRPPVAFAYPNGLKRDFTNQHEAAVREAGYSIAFSLEPGPTSLDNARQHPTSISRIYIGLNDDMPRFAAKLAGASHLGSLLRYRSARRIRSGAPQRVIDIPQ